jgi:hypothetical protein
VMARDLIATSLPSVIAYLACKEIA